MAWTVAFIIILNRYKLISPSDWTAIHTHDKCVIITLGEGIPLSECRLRIVSSERQLIEEEKLTTRCFEVTLNTDEPLFAELTQGKLLPCMKFIEKTGETYYN